MDEELQFLTEKDMEYFKKLAEKGEALILTISDEDLLSLDFSKERVPEKDEESGGPFTQEELTAWVEKNRAEFQKRYEENQKILSENEKMKEAIAETQEKETGAEGQPLSLSSGNPEKRKKPKASLTERLATTALDEEKAGIINQAILSGLDEQLILMLLDENLSAKEMGKLLEVFEKEA